MLEKNGRITSHARHRMNSALTSGSQCAFCDKRAYSVGAVRVGMMKENGWIARMAQHMRGTRAASIICCDPPSTRKKKRCTRTHPSAIRMKSASPWTITARSLFPITFASTPFTAGGKLWSPPRPTNTFSFEHSTHVTFVGAWIAFLTSSRSK